MLPPRLIKWTTRLMPQTCEAQWNHYFLAAFIYPHGRVSLGEIFILIQIDLDFPLGYSSVAPQAQVGIYVYK